jgi:ABC-type antimicrobial peptide transport system permease subunit
MDHLLQDLRYTSRTLRKSPGFAAVAVLMLALGIGANTAIFSVVDGLLLRPLPYPEPDALVQIRHVNQRGGSILNFAYPNFVDLREQNRSLDAVGAYASVRISVTGGSEPTRVEGAYVTEGFFESLGVTPELGRAFAPNEVGASAAGVAVVGHGYWQDNLGGVGDLSEAVVRVGEAVYRVVGVMPQGFAFPGETRLWLPSGASLETENRTAHNYHVVGRLSGEVSLEQAQEDLSAIARRLKATYGDDTAMSDVAAVPLREELVGPTRTPLLILLGAAGFLLLITCANVANLLLARMAARQREISIRLALGASRGRVATQLLTESLVLSLAGGGLAVALALWGVPAMLALEPGGLPRLGEVGINWTVLLFALAASVLTACVLGVMPALSQATGDARGALAEGQLTQTGGVRSQHARRVLVVAQVALTLVLLAGAGLLGRSFLSLLTLDPGYRTGGGLVMDLWMPGGEGSVERAGRFHDELRARLQALPGVAEVGGVSSFPLSGGVSDGSFVILDGPADVAGLISFDQVMRQPELIERMRQMFNDPERTGQAEFRVASEGYFRAMGIPLRRGRFFDERDVPDATHVALISQSLAETRWPGEDPIGKWIEFGNMDGDLTPFMIVGVVGDVRDRALGAIPRPTFYGNARQRPTRTLEYSVVMRAADDATALIPSARAVVRELRADVPVEFRTVDEIVSSSVSDRRFVLLLLGFFAATALLLAVTGIYGVISYLAAQRTKEMGIRLALGAATGQVSRLLVGQGAALALIGVGIGLLAALGLTRLLGSLLYDVGAADPVTFGAAALLLGGVAVLASYLPARRVSRLDPMSTLRRE